MWTDLLAIFGLTGPFSLTGLSLHTDKSRQAKLGPIFQSGLQSAPATMTVTPTETPDTLSSSLRAELEYTSSSSQSRTNRLSTWRFSNSRGQSGGSTPRGDGTRPQPEIHRPCPPTRMQEGDQDAPEAIEAHKSLEG
ncbi:hypothetical protein RF11_15938 [Thelohanellus kitauei]|uniref:Uncharacterized protein n=1 Tax=Thelohanellus kitauei TaxID=669202 RepID=A0A0C2IM27_THEKT|nr:hypothetical protein RF11_15938 [Thelohanellus kitauei]